MTMTGEEVIEAIAVGRLPRTTPQRLPENHPYWKAPMRKAAQEEADDRKAQMERARADAANAALKRFLRANREGLACCAIPPRKDVERAKEAFRAAAAALRTALDWARVAAHPDHPWPLGSDQVDGHYADRFEDLLSDERVGARYTADDLDDLAAALAAGPDQASWVKALARGSSSRAAP
jgi:hypothetical protein